MQLPIWAVSTDKTLFDWTSKVFKKERAVFKIDPNKILHGPFPALILIECDYQCRYDICVRRFRIPLLFPEVPSVIARPVLLKDKKQHPAEYLIAHISDPQSKQEIHESEGWRRVDIQRRFFLFTPDPTLKPIRLQQEIIDSRGKVAKVGNLAKQVALSIPRLSTAFSQATGIPLKSYLNKVRLCHAMWELTSSEKSIKNIALDYGYKSASFSLRFHRTFGKWPSETRKLKN
jgi:AraC-like DNA-binding protein